MLEAERQETAGDVTGAQTAVPGGETGSFFRLGISLAADEYQGGHNTSLEYSKEDTRYQQTSIALAAAVDAVAMPERTTLTPRTLLAENLVRIWTECANGSAQVLRLSRYVTVLTHGQFRDQVSDRERSCDAGKLIFFSSRSSFISMPRAHYQKSQLARNMAW